MTCDECDRNPKEFPYRWDTATIIIVACPKHAGEVIEHLNKTRK